MNGGKIVDGVCGGCGALAAATLSLSRCSRCKWTSYCSKVCQLRHWKDGGHRRLCGLLGKVGAFRDGEELFWQSRSPSELAFFASSESLDPESMRFYGEVLFVATGLKPCLLFSNLPSSWRIPFISTVILPSAILQNPSMALYTIRGNVETPAEYALGETLLLANTAHIECRSISEELHLVPISLGQHTTDVALPTSTHIAQVPRIVEEAQLARLLDYPISLDECADPMIEVGYFVVFPDKSKQLLQSYCASAIASHHQRIHTHFLRYQQSFDQGTLPLTIEIMRLS